VQQVRRQQQLSSLGIMGEPDASRHFLHEQRTAGGTFICVMVVVCQLLYSMVGDSVCCMIRIWNRNRRPWGSCMH
jgi:hypothetical protein